MSYRRFPRDARTRRVPHGGGGFRRAWASSRARRAALLVILGTLLAGAGAFAWIVKDVPNPGQLDDQFVQESTKIYDRTGTTVLYEFGEIRRTWVPLAEMAPAIRDATVAAEDHDFYRHRGLNFRGIARALLANVRGQSLQGGSSITQQLVKNTILTPERTLTRKIREAVLALEVERRFEKDEILEMYLNIIPYGANAHGVEAAAATYFNTTAKDLSLAQAALLAALPKAPTYYSPHGSHTEELFARKDAILDAMAREGFIQKEEGDAAKRVRLSFQERADRISAPHFVFYVRERLEEEYGETLLNRGGLKVLTTLDAVMQRAAEEAVAAQAPKNRQRDSRNAALVAMNPKNGDVLAMVGSVDYFDTENDGNVNVAIRNRSPGSSYKPIIYAQAFKKGFTPDTILADVPIDFGLGEKAYKPQNYDLSVSGPVTIRQALARSLNIPAVQALYLAGLRESLALSEEMGFTTLTDPDRYGLSLVLGGGEVRLLDLTAAYGVFATEGIRHPHRAILNVKDPRGRVLFDITNDPPEGIRVLEPPIARLITDILSDNGARAPVFGAASPLQLGERPVAAKTGTAQEFRDGWTIGYTPSLVAGVWVGNNDNTPMKRGPGADTAAPIWNAFMRKVLAGTPIEPFTKPEKITTGRGALDGRLREKRLKVDRETETILPEDCPVPMGTPTTFVEFHSILFSVRKEDPRGDPPTDGSADPMFARWEAGVRAWSEKWNRDHEDERKRYVAEIPDAACDPELLRGRPSVSIISPRDTIVRSSPLRVAASVTVEEAGIERVEFFANDKNIGERGEEPYEVSYAFPSSLSGRVRLVIRATSTEGKTGQAAREILINPDNTKPTITVHTPRNNETIAPSTFPYHIKVDATDPSGVGIVDVLYRPSGGDKTSRAGRTDTPVTPGGPRYEIVWGTPPAPGTYALWVTATDTTGNVSQTPPRTIIIP